MPEEKKKKQPLWKVYGLVLCCGCFLLFDIFAGLYKRLVRACCPPRATLEAAPDPVAGSDSDGSVYASAERPLIACATANV